MLDDVFERRLGERADLWHGLNSTVMNISMPDFGSLWNASSAESMSTSTEMVVNNGHMVKKTTKCQNGKCQTTTEDKKVDTPSTNPAAPQLRELEQPVF